MSSPEVSSKKSVYITVERQLKYGSMVCTTNLIVKHTRSVFVS